MNAIAMTILLALVATAQAETAKEVPAEVPAPAPIEGPCFARFVPERKDDFAWENDRVAFRMYGPTLGVEEPDQSGSGVDVWSKKVRYPVINKWYAAGNYHRDHGEGLDCYKVGTSRGCGGLGIWNGTGLDSAGVFAKHRVIQGEGDEVAFELDYAPWVSGQATVSEVKRIRLAKGSNFFDASSTFSVKGAENVTVGIGIVLREGGDLRHGDNWIAYAEPPDKKLGSMFCAVILPKKAEFKQINDHALLLAPVADGGVISYRAGAAWERGLDFSTPEAWFAHVTAEAEKHED